MKDTHVVVLPVPGGPCMMNMSCEMSYLLTASCCGSFSQSVDECRKAMYSSGMRVMSWNRGRVCRTWLLAFHELAVLGHGVDLGFTRVFLFFCCAVFPIPIRRLLRAKRRVLDLPQPVHLPAHVEYLLLVAQVHHRVVFPLDAPLDVSQGVFVPAHRHVTAHHRNRIGLAHLNITTFFVVEDQLDVAVPHLVHDAFNKWFQLVDRRLRVEQPDDVAT